MQLQILFDYPTNEYPNVAEKDMINLAKLAEQQKSQRAEEVKNGSSKQKHDKIIAESFEPVTKKLEEVFKKPGLEGKDNQTPNIPAIQNVRGTQSLRDTLSRMKKYFKFLKLTETTNGEVYCNRLVLKP